MNTNELTALLGRIQVLDNRQVDELTLQAWAPLVENIEYEDAVDAVNAHFKASDKYLLPVHVVEGSRRFRSERVRTRSRLTVRRILELGGEEPRLWDGSDITSDDLAAIGKKLETGDLTAEHDVREIVTAQARTAQALEEGRRMIRAQQEQG